MDEELKVQQEQHGTVTFANEVLATIAGIAACDVPGVAGMCGGLKDGIAELLGRKNLTKGVKVTVNENSVTVDIQIVVDFGVRVPEVCDDMQQTVKKAIENMTGLNVKEVNIAIDGVRFKELGAPAAQEEEEDE